MHLADVPVCAYIDCSYFQIRFFSFKIGQICYRQIHKKSIISVKQTLFCSFLDYIFSFKRYTESKHIICHVTLEHCNVKYDLQKRKQSEDTISPSARPHTARLPPLHSTRSHTETLYRQRCGMGEWWGLTKSPTKFLLWRKQKDVAAYMSTIWRKKKISVSQPQYEGKILEIWLWTAFEKMSESQ